MPRTPREAEWHRAAESAGSAGPLRGTGADRAELVELAEAVLSSAAGPSTP